MIIPVYGREKFIMTFYNDFVQKIMIKRAQENILILKWYGGKGIVYVVGNISGCTEYNLSARNYTLLRNVIYH